MRLNEGLIYTNENCIGCNKCISACPVLGANVADKNSSGNVILVDGEKCIGCGKCMTVCHHNAREYRDDTLEMFKDLEESNEDISILISKSFALQYPEKWKAMLGFLKQKGIKHIYNIDFGARISLWAFLEYTKVNETRGMITQQCPVVINYVLKHKPELISKLMPIQSPILSAAIYLKKYKDVSQKFALIGPCIARKNEIEDESTGGVIKYSITYKEFEKYYEENKLEEVREEDFEFVDHGSMSYQLPGGIAEVFHATCGIDKFIRSVNGEDVIFNYIDNYKNKIVNKEEIPYIVDITNCLNGCDYGTGTTSKFTKPESILKDLNYELNFLRNNKHTIYYYGKNPEKNRKDLEHAYGKLDVKDFLRNYTSNSYVYEKMISNEEIDRIFNDIGKDTEEKRNINCGACGYKTCKQMVMAIAKGYNYKLNCIHSVRDELTREKKELSSMVERINEKNEEIVKVNNAKTDFLAKMSHEIRTPINAITGLTEIILDEEKDEKLKDYAKDIKGASENLLALINDILDLTKIESKKVEIINAEYSTEALFKDVVNMMRIPIERKGLKFNVTISPNISKTLYGDITRIRQILINLLNNAYKFTKEGCINFTALSNKENDIEKLTFIIEDTGIGIKKEDFEKLFSEFEQVYDENNRGIEGTGLGLPISRNLAHLMDGDITVESEYGVGSKFTATLKQKISNSIFKDVDETMSEVEKIFEKETSNFSFKIENANVLVVDDNEVNLKVACKLLEKYGIMPDVATGGKEAIDKILKNTYDLVFMDHMMPDIDGIIATQTIREHDEKYYKELPIVALTANAITGMREEFLEAGFSDFISKPIDIKELEKVLKRWLLSKVSSDEAREKYNELLLSKRKDIEEKFLKNQNKLTIDVLLGITNCAGSTEIYVDLLETFKTSGREKIRELNEKFNEKLFNDYKIIAHGIKSASANIGAMKLSEIAKAQELAVKEENISFVENNHEAFIKELEFVLELLLPYDSGEKNVYNSLNKINVEKDDILSAIKDVEEFLNTSSIMKAIDRIKKILEYSYIDIRVMEQLNDIRNLLITKFDIKEAREKIETIKKII